MCGRGQRPRYTVCLNLILRCNRERKGSCERSNCSSFLETRKQNTGSPDKMPQRVIAKASTVISTTGPIFLRPQRQPLFHAQDADYVMTGGTYLSSRTYSYASSRKGWLAGRQPGDVSSSSWYQAAVSLPLDPGGPTTASRIIFPTANS